MKKSVVKESVVLEQPSVTEFADAFNVTAKIIHSKDSSIGNGVTHSLVEICKAFGVDPEKVTKEQAFVVFDRFLYVAAFLYACILKNPKKE